MTLGFNHKAVIAQGQRMANATKLDPEPQAPFDSITLKETVIRKKLDSESYPLANVINIL